MAEWVVLGKVSGLFGVEGWVRVFSHTAPRTAITTYRPIFLQRHGAWQPFEMEAGRAHGAGVVVKFAGYDDRDQAATLLHSAIAVRRKQLAPLPAGEYYWTDLQGLRVVNTEGVELGVVDHLFATGANDVIVVKGAREHLVPFIKGQVVVKIDLEQRMVHVDWDADF